jgi:hypothetical protein
MRTFGPAKPAIDPGHDPAARHRILVEVLCREDLEPDFEIRVANEKDRIPLAAVSRAL